jgi:hypothetical protein
MIVSLLLTIRRIVSLPFRLVGRLVRALVGH